MEYIPAKYILIRTKSTAWFGTDHTMNLYRGCCHGCLYCDSRSDCYHIPDFDRQGGRAAPAPGRAGPESPPGLHQHGLHERSLQPL